VKRLPTSADRFLEIPILVDSREQWPFTFGRHPTITTGLPTGDYSLRDLQHCLVVERKSASDLRGCIGVERNRFERELRRLSRMDYSCVVVESDLRIVLEERIHAPGRRRLSAPAIMGSLSAWSSRFKVPFMFASNRLHAREFVYRTLRTWWGDHTFAFDRKKEESHAAGAVVVASPG